MIAKPSTRPNNPALDFARAKSKRDGEAVNTIEQPALDFALAKSKRDGEAVALARPEGLEPSTAGLEGRCSVQLSYGRFDRSANTVTSDEYSAVNEAAEELVGVERFELPTSCSQSRCATRLRHTPLTVSECAMILARSTPGQLAPVNRIDSPSWLTAINSPGAKRPSRSAADSGFSSARCIARFSGLAPYTGS